MSEKDPKLTIAALELQCLTELMKKVKNKPEIHSCDNKPLNSKKVSKNSKTD